MNGFFLHKIKACILSGFFTALVILSCGFPSARAQTDAASPPPSDTSVLLVTDTSPEYALGPYLHVTLDDEIKVSEVLADNLQVKGNAVYNMHVRGRKGKLLNGDVLALGALSSPAWVIFSVENASWNENWVLSFGGRLHGRTGVVKKIILFDTLSRTKYLDNTVSKDNQFIEKQSRIGTTVFLKIPRGKTALFLMYVEPSSGLFSTLAPRIITRDHYDAKNRSIYNTDRIVNAMFAFLVAVSLASVLMRHFYGGLFFVAYFVLQATFYNFQNEYIHAAGVSTTSTMHWLQLLSAASAVLMMKFFLGGSRRQPVPDRAVIFCLLILAGIGLNVTFVMADSGSASSLFVMGAFLAVLLFLVLLSVAYGYNGASGSYVMGAAWAVLAVGLLATLLSLSGVIPPSGHAVAAYWYCFMPHGLLVAAALVKKLLREELDAIEERQEHELELENLVFLREHKDSSESERLLRMIENERLVMNELREREIEQAEEMRKAKNAADEANRAKSAFLAVVSHEIRTPMNGIMGMVRLLLETNLDGQQQEYAQTIQDSGDAMISLLNDILDFEKIESGKMDLEHVDFDLHRVVNGVMTLMSGHAAAKNIFLKVDMAETIPRYVIGDPVRLRQVLLNLTGNAIKFTAEGGVTLRISQDEQGEKAGRSGMHKIKFAIQDTGIGISVEVQKNLFNPFSQAHSGIARRFGGTGLGLAISQRLIEAMGSRIRIDSTEGQGSTFHFTLMMESGSNAKADGRDASVLAQKTENALHILIVEDNDISRKLIKEFVDRMGHHAILAASGEEALEKLGSEKADVVLMDVEMPGISGLQATEAIRSMSDPLKACTPVIAMTGNVTPEDIKRCYAVNMNGHLSKPVDPKRLKQMLDKVGQGVLDNPVQVTPPPSLEPEATGGRMDEIEMPEVVAPEIAVEEIKLHRAQDGDEVAHVFVEPERASISTLAMSLPELEISDEDLEEDSFAQALEQPDEGPEKDGGKVCLDNAMLTSLRRSIGAGKFDELMQGLFEKAYEIIGSLNELHDNGSSDLVAMRARAHELKGMAGNFGLKELSELASEAERAARENDPASLALTIPLLQGACDRARSMLRRRAA